MKLLLLAGTSEARELANRLAEDVRFDVTATLAGATRDPRPLPVRTHIGGFGGEAAQEAWMRDHGTMAVVDATHPFAAQISWRTQAICARLGVPYLQILRPGWAAGPGDDWTRVADASEAAAAIARGARAFLATGRQTLGAFAARGDVTLFLRQIDPTEAPFSLPRGDYVIGTPPFSEEEEISLFKTLKVDVLVVKDAGGRTGGKLAAARALGLPVIVIDRPPQPPGEKAETVEAALAWLARLI